MIKALINYCNTYKLKNFINDLLELPKGYRIKEITFIEATNLDKDNNKTYDLAVKDEAENNYIIDMRKKNIEPEETNNFKKMYDRDVTYIEQLEESLTNKISLPVVTIYLLESELFTPFVKFHNMPINEKLNNAEDFKDYILIEFGNFKNQLLTNVDKWWDLFKSEIDKKVSSEK